MTPRLERHAVATTVPAIAASPGLSALRQPVLGVSAGPAYAADGAICALALVLAAAWLARRLPAGLDGVRAHRPSLTAASCLTALLAADLVRIAA